MACQLFFILFFTLCVTQSSMAELCRRVFFKMPSEETFPYFQVEGVYNRTGLVVDNFPIFEHEQGGLYFQHSLKLNKLYFGRSVGSKEYIGLSADTVIGSLNSPRWMNYAGQRPFDRVLRRWTTYDPLTKTHNWLPSTQTIEAFCVQNFTFKCTSGKLFFNSTFTNGTKVVNSQTTDYFYPLPGIFSNSRPVFIHSTQKTWYLFYGDNHWIVGPRYQEARGFIKVRTPVRRPEYVTRNWELFNPAQKRWHEFANPVGMRCKGEVTVGGCGASPSPCPVQAECYENVINETVCKCNPGHVGPRCGTPTYRCSTYQPKSGFESMAVSELGYEGDFISVFCARGMKPVFRVGVCKKPGTSATSATWDVEGACTRKYVPPTTLTPRTRSPIRRRYRYRYPTYYRRRRNSNKFDTGDNFWIRPTVLTLVILLQILTPCFFLCCDVGFFRATSLFMFVSMVIWAGYLCGCAATKCAQYGDLLSDFVIMAIVMLLVGYFFNIVESFFCSEREYVSMVVEDTSLQQYLEVLRSKDVTLIGSIECYHMETRTRTVYYTDANGNSQTRIETYQERVVTYTESRTFHHSYFRDVSATELPPLSTRQVTRLKISKIVKCGDEETADALYKFKDDIVEENKHRDVSIVYYQDERIDGYQEHVCAYLDRVERPFWLNSCCFWLATVLCLTWPYRWFFKFCTGKSFYTLEKELFLRAPPPTQQLPSAPGSYSCPPTQVMQPQGFQPNFAPPAGPPPDYASAVNGSIPLGFQNTSYSQSRDQLINNQIDNRSEREQNL